MFCHRGNSLEGAHMQNKRQSHEQAIGPTGGAFTLGVLDIVADHRLEVVAIHTATSLDKGGTSIHTRPYRAAPALTLDCTDLKCPALVGGATFAANPRYSRKIRCIWSVIGFIR